MYTSKDGAGHTIRGSTDPSLWMGGDKPYIIWSVPLPPLECLSCPPRPAAGSAVSASVPREMSCSHFGPEYKGDGSAPESRRLRQLRDSDLATRSGQRSCAGFCGAWEWPFRIYPQTTPTPERPFSRIPEGHHPVWTICQIPRHSRRTCDSPLCPTQEEGCLMDAGCPL